MAFVRPERHPSITRVAGKAEAGLEQTTAKSPSTRLGFEKKKPQLCGLVIQPDAKDTAEPPVALCDPGAFPHRSMNLKEARNDIGDQRLEALVEALVTSV